MLIYVGPVFGLVGLVCYIIVVVKMFQNNKTTPGIISLVGLLACGLGYLYALVYGWTKAKDWNITPLMIVWTLAFLVGIGINMMTFREAMNQMRVQAQQQVQAPQMAPPAIP
jgi:hypothetical protein